MKLRFINKKILIWIIMIGVIIIMGVFGIKALSPAREINEEKNFSLNNIKEIQVSVLNESVHVIQTEAGQEIKFHLYGKAKEETKLKTENDNEKIVVIDNRSKCGLFEEMFLDIYVPKSYNNNLSINVTSGDTKMDTFNLSSFSLKSTSGKMEIEKILTENLVLKSTAGGITLNECCANVAKIETTSGKVNIEYKEFDNSNVNIKTSSGTITLNLPGSSEFSLKAQTNAGKIKNDFTVSGSSGNDKKKIEGQIGTKSNEVILKSSSGSINIIKGVPGGGKLPAD